MTKHTSLEWLTIGQAAKYLGVSRDTLRRWESKGKLKSYRTPGGRRRYTMYDLELAIKHPKKQTPSTPKPIKRQIRAPQHTQAVVEEPKKPTLETKNTIQRSTKNSVKSTLFSTLQIILLASIIGLLIFAGLSGLGKDLITHLKTGEKIIDPVSETYSSSE